MEDPDFKNWNKYDRNIVPKENKYVLLHLIYPTGKSSYVCVLIRMKEKGYLYDLSGPHWWDDYRQSGKHWIYVDDIKI